MPVEKTFGKKAAGETNREMAEIYGFPLKRIKKLVERENKKVRLIAAGCTPQEKVSGGLALHSDQVRHTLHSHILT